MRKHNIAQNANTIARWPARRKSSHLATFDKTNYSFECFSEFNFSRVAHLTTLVRAFSDIVNRTKLSTVACMENRVASNAAESDVKVTVVCQRMSWKSSSHKKIFCFGNITNEYSPLRRHRRKWNVCNATSRLPANGL